MIPWTYLAEHPLVVPLLLLFVLAGLAGAALLALMLAPERHRRAVDRVGAGVVVNAALGLLVLVPPAVGLLALHHNGIRVGRGLLWLVLVSAVALGIGVCARRLGERVLPEGHPLRQLALGLVALLGTQLLPVCWPLLMVVAALGLGAWLRAGGRQAAIAPA